MWGMEWEDLPTCVRGRVPKDTGEESRYYPDQFVALLDTERDHFVVSPSEREDDHR